MTRSFEGSITQLVPHRGTMLLVDRVLADDALGISVEATIKPDGPFATEDGMPAWVGIELMAQTVAAWAGLRRLEAKEAVRLGFLLGTRRYECTQPFFPFGARVEVKAKQELVAENGLAVFACQISLEGHIVANAQLNVFQPSNVEQYLQGHHV